MNIKKIICLLSILSLTGCSVEYNINVKDDKIYENINIYIDKNDSENVKSLNYYYENGVIAFTEGFEDYTYDLNKIDNDNFGLNMNFEYGNNIAFAVSSFFTNCYQKSNISSDDNKIYITASDFRCYSYNYEEVNSAIINLTTNHNVINHNADKVSNGTYIWYPLNNNKGISLILEKNSEKEGNIQKPTIIPGNNDKDNSSKNEETSLGVGLAIFGGFIILIAFIFFIKIKKQR